MIWTLRVRLLFGAYAEEGWEGSLEVDSASTLHELHLAIQNAVDFDNDHLYEFYIARAERSRERIRFDDENEGVYETKIVNIFPLPKNNSLFYMFDYGDSWLFKVSRSRKQPLAAETGVTYPRLISEVGEKPPQYPDFEEDF